jgi:amino acid transporter
MLIFVAYEGFELIANAAEDVRRPAYTLPRAFFGAVGLVVVLYAVIAIVTVGSLAPAAIVRDSDFALAAAAKPGLGEAGFRVVAVSAVLATFSAINATLYGAARLSYAIATEGELPPALERRVWRQPVGLLVTASGALLLANTLKLSSICSIASACFLMVFVAVNAAALRMAGEIGASKTVAGLGVAGCLAAVTVLLARTTQSNPVAVVVLGAFVLVSAAAEWVWLRWMRGECRPSKAGTIPAVTLNPVD